MSWGQEQSGGWGHGGWGPDSYKGMELTGQHLHSCIADCHGWGTHGLMGGYYDAKCPGCERDRACESWGHRDCKRRNKILKGIASLVGGAIVVKSIWD